MRRWADAFFNLLSPPEKQCTVYCNVSFIAKIMDHMDDDKEVVWQAHKVKPNIITQGRHTVMVAPMMEDVV